MRTLDFSVSGQTVTRVGDFSSIIKGSKGYLQCRFDLSNEWTTYRIAAIFQYKDQVELVQVENGICNVPDSVTDGDYFLLKLLGVKSANQYFYTETILIEQED